MDLYKKISKETKKDEDDLLHTLACEWLNSATVQDGVSIKNYQRWSRFGEAKQKLKIAGIFPKSGSNYVAPELMPGKIKFLPC